MQSIFASYSAILHLAQALQGFDDGFDLVCAFLVFAGEVVGELGGGGGGGLLEEVADELDLVGELFGPLSGLIDD